MNKAMHVKKGDTVKIIAGNEKPRKVKGEKVVKTGVVTAVNPEKGTVVVDGVNMGFKHKKAKNAKNTGGRMSVAMPMDSSNVMVICGDCNMPTRISYKVSEEEGKKLKVRICKKCGAVLDKKVESVKAKKEKKEREKAAKKEKKEKEKAAKKTKKGDKEKETATESKE